MVFISQSSTDKKINYLTKLPEVDNKLKMAVNTPSQRSELFHESSENYKHMQRIINNSECIIFVYKIQTACIIIMKSKRKDLLNICFIIIRQPSISNLIISILKLNYESLRRPVITINKYK